MIVLPPATILVTGASGFIGSWVCLALLNAGYLVRSTVRTAEKGEYLKTLFSAHISNFSYVLVGDVTKVDGSWY